ncbi:heat shock 70 kDa protein 12A-like isoform X2 [Pecten maximus]|nr:heat shock 70 kDa protein 12A-like isoform X2 [Pecten maximus]XP_033742696.1 heat shock 70 kDa protein 12A-like isoform X2 [Pecten maximus]XP_033742697.1 heat shock 70 kDa protein 12A-like isoform X2 [Pecten maximus]
MGNQTGKTSSSPVKSTASKTSSKKRGKGKSRHESTAVSTSQSSPVPAKAATATASSTSSSQKLSTVPNTLSTDSSPSFSKRPVLQGDCTSALSNEGTHRQKTHLLFGKKSVKKSSFIVAAIDFGTTFSGFAYCTKDGYKHSAGPQIQMHTWAAKTTMTAKAPTCVLLDFDKNFKSFGYEANSEFQDDENAEENCYFFKHFKMKLYEQKDELTRDTMFESENGMTMPAIRVFSAIIKFFKDKLVEDMNSKDTKAYFLESDIHWVLTVPAIWNLKAKQFMREAAHLAGIEDNQLTLALEPEAASLYCRRVPNSVVRHPGDGPSIANFQAGAKYLIMDLGGGTIDITAHEVLEDGHLKEINEPTGGYWGGLRVNEEFTRFLQRLFGQDVLTELKENYPADWQAIADDFELKKCAYDPNGVMGKITIRIPLTLVEEYENTTGCSLREAISQTPFKDHLEFKQDKLRMDKAIFEKFFEESITNVVSKVEKLLRENPQLHNLDTILVVGGYAESPLMQQAIKDKFAGKYKIVIPSDPNLAILKGAVMYGFELDAVKSRVCKYTYGIGHQRTFLEGFDDPKKKWKHGRHSYVDDAFDIHVSKGDLVQYGTFQDGKDYHPVNDDQTQAWFDFYASDDKDPKFVYENSCACLGFVGVELSPRQRGLDATVTLEINISGTDIEVKATEKRTGNVTNAYCNFLG